MCIRDRCLVRRDGNGAGIANSARMQVRFRSSGEDDEVAFEIQYALAGSGSWGAALRVERPADIAQDISRTVEDLAVGTSYDFRVRSLYPEDDVSGWVTLASQSTLAGTLTAPGVPIGPRVLTELVDGADLDWCSPASGSAPTRYQAQVRELGTTLWEPAVELNNNQVPSGSISGLDQNTTYECQIRGAIHSFGNQGNVAGPWSGTFRFTTSVGQQIDPPAEFYGCEVASTGDNRSEVLMKWAPPASLPSLNQYQYRDRVQRVISGLAGFYYRGPYRISGLQRIINFGRIDNDRQSDEIVQIELRSFLAGNVSSWVELTDPSGMHHTSAVPGAAGGTIDVRYCATAFLPYDMQIRYRQRGTSTWSVDSHRPQPPVIDDRFFTVSGLTPGREYEFQLRLRVDGFQWIDWGASFFGTAAQGVSVTATINSIPAGLEGTSVKLGAAVGGTATGGISYNWSAAKGTFDDNTLAEPTWTRPQVGAAGEDVSVSLSVTRQGETANATRTARVNNNPTFSTAWTSDSDFSSMNEGSSARRLYVRLGGEATGSVTVTATTNASGASVAVQSGGTLRVEEMTVDPATSQLRYWIDFTPPTDVSANTNVQIAVTTQRQGKSHRLTGTIHILSLIHI